ncbi:hypothetical protein GCM10027046_23300 [Uliginosibacterium flavum]
MLVIAGGELGQGQPLGRQGRNLGEQLQYHLEFIHRRGIRWIQLNDDPGFFTRTKGQSDAVSNRRFAGWISQVIEQARPGQREGNTDYAGQEASLMAG